RLPLGERCESRDAGAVGIGDPLVSISAHGVADIRFASSSTNSAAAVVSISPGFVQNCPTPSVTEACRPAAISAPRSRSARGRMNTGLMLAHLGEERNRFGARRGGVHQRTPTAARTGEADGLDQRMLDQLDPPSNPSTSTNTPCGTTSVSTRPTSREVFGCAGCALTITGHPAASAEAVSPPATENARGKLLAPNTATGPTGRRIERTSA